MLKDITNCPHCGKSFSDVGIYEVRYYRHYADDGIVVLGEGFFHDTGLQCGGCDGFLQFRDTDDSYTVQVIG